MVDLVMSVGKTLLVFQPNLIALAWIFAAAGLSVSNWYGSNDFFWIKDWNLQTVLLFVGITLLMAGANLLAQFDQHSKEQTPSYPSNIELANTIRESIPRLAPALIIVGYLMIIPGGILSALAGFLATLVLWLLYGSNAILWRDNNVVQSTMQILVGMFFFAVGWGRGDAPILAIFTLSIPYTLILIVLSLTVVFALGDTTQATKHVGQILVGVCTVSLVGAMSLAYSLGDPLGSTAPALMLPFYIVALIRGGRIDILRSFRYSLLVMTIFTGARYPYLFLPIIIVFYLSRFYYSRTHGLAYPTLEGPEWSDGVAKSTAKDS
ncbi:hypothetical protein ACFL6E_00385 [Candidatus Neomarinimicrobiota bacterium]